MPRELHAGMGIHYQVDGNDHTIKFALLSTFVASTVAGEFGGNPGTYLDGIANALKLPCGANVVFYGGSFYNINGHLFASYEFTTPITGTHIAPIAEGEKSQSAALGIRATRGANIDSGRASQRTSHLFVGHKDFNSNGRKKLKAGTETTVDAMLAYLVQHVPVGTDLRGVYAFQPDVTVQFMAYAQKTVGS